MHKSDKKRRLLVKKMLLDVQGKSDTPARLYRDPESIGRLTERKWVKEIQL